MTTATMACLRHIPPPHPSPRSWLVARVTVPPESADEASGALSDLRTNGLEEEERHNGDITLSAYFDAQNHTPQSLAASIRGLIPRGHIDITMLEWDIDDQRWRQFFKPCEIIPGVVVSPSWERYEPSSGQHVITVDPGIAFGTGLHPTTRMCAEAIDAWHRESRPRGTLLHVGCGSGILCLIGHALGARVIAGVENDADAARVARENFINNGAPSIPVYESLDTLSDPYSLVVANILMNTLLALKEELVRLTEPGGWLVLSGVTDHQADELERAFADHAQRRMLFAYDEWRCVVLERSH